MQPKWTLKDYSTQQITLKKRRAPIKGRLWKNLCIKDIFVSLLPQFVQPFPKRLPTILSLSHSSPTQLRLPCAHSHSSLERLWISRVNPILLVVRLYEFLWRSCQSEQWWKMWEDQQQLGKMTMLKERWVKMKGLIEVYDQCYGGLREGDR